MHLSPCQLFISVKLPASNFVYIGVHFRYECLAEARIPQEHRAERLQKGATPRCFLRPCIKSSVMFIKLLTLRIFQTCRVQDEY